MKQAIIILIMTTAFIFSCGTGKAPQNTNNSNNNQGQNNNSAIAPPAYDPDNPVGGNINSKEPIAYADREFLRGIVDYDSVAAIEPPQGWPKLLDNSFHIDYNSGEMRMVRPEMVFGVAEALGIEREYQADYLDIENCDFRLYALYVQKVKSEVYFKALYNYEDKIPEYLAVYKKLENDSVANRKDLAIQRCYRLTEDGPLLMIDYVFNNYFFERPMNPNPMLAKPLDDVENIFDYIKQAYGNVFIKDNKYVIASYYNANSKKPNLPKWKSGSFILKLQNTKKYTIYNSPDSLNNHDGFQKYNFAIWEDQMMYTKGFGSFFDEQKPFKYSFDKMIDGNPGTSYVENSANDMINFSIAFPDNDLIVSAISIVNGYALNNDFYFKNNRIKQVKLKLKGYKVEREEVFNLQETLKPQIFEFPEFSLLAIEILTTEVYKGSKWNDTCLSELNIKTKAGWLF